MSTHAHCPNCGCSDDGTKIYQCNDCGKVFCRACSGYGLPEGTIIIPGATCPRCKGLAGNIGKIVSTDGDEDDDDSSSGPSTSYGSGNGGCLPMLMAMLIVFLLMLLFDIIVEVVTAISKR
jgi:hypothetical protein